MTQQEKDKANEWILSDFQCLIQNLDDGKLLNLNTLDDLYNQNESNSKNKVVINGEHGFIIVYIFNGVIDMMEYRYHSDVEFSIGYDDYVDFYNENKEWMN